MDDETKRTLVWVAETLQRVVHGNRMTLVCGTCNHGIEHHYDGEGGCQFPKTMGAPVRLCECELFDPS
jgi:hypothetical protein